MEQSHFPLVSVCIPCYKNPELLSRCLDSVIKQSYRNIEIIITDDSPNDEAQSVISKYADDPRILYFQNSPSLGSPENWNAGLKIAKGEYIKIMHHDDWFETDQALQVFVEKAVATGADFICSNCYNVSPEKKNEHPIVKRYKKRWEQNRSLILYANYLGNPSTILFRRAKDNEIQYDPKSIWYVDVIFYYEYTQKYPKITFIDEYLVSTSAGLETQVTNSSISTSIGVKEFLYVDKKHDLYAKNPFLTQLSLLEILKRYKISSRKEFEDIIGTPFSRPFPYFLLKIPVHHQFYNILKHLVILY